MVTVTDGEAPRVRLDVSEGLVVGATVDEILRLCVDAEAVGDGLAPGDRLYVGEYDGCGQKQIIRSPPP